MKEAALKDKIRWRFNPPSAPHFGGIWEAGVKSLKTHIYRVVGLQILTYEEFLTILTQIESMLNSRPLTPLSPDPNDLRPLTPSHFLLLEAPISLPEDDLTNVAHSRLSRWQLIQQMVQHIWKRWSSEYLHTLT